MISLLTDILISNYMYACTLQNIPVIEDNTIHSWLWEVIWCCHTAKLGRVSQFDALLIQTHLLGIGTTQTHLLGIGTTLDTKVRVYFLALGEYS